MATQILMPALSPTMEEGKLSKWLVKEGDEVHSGDILAEIETDKATMEFEAVDEGRIVKILVPEGSEGVKVNQPIAVLLGEDEDASTTAPPPPSAPLDISSAMESIKQAVSKEVKKPEAKPQSTPSPPREGARAQRAGEGAATSPPSHSAQAALAPNALPRKGGGEMDI